MKKQILTLTMCLALTATAALADVTKQATPATVSTTAAGKLQAKPTSPKNLVKQAEQPKVITREEAKKRFEERRNQQREQMYCKLGLTAEQKVKAEALDVKSKAAAEPIIIKLQAEGRKLKDLKAKKASKLEIFKQERAFKATKNELKNSFEASKKSFEAILTKEQKDKFKAMGEERKKEMQKMKKKGCHFNKAEKSHKKQPPCKMDKPMGPPPEMGVDAPIGAPQQCPARPQAK